MLFRHVREGRSFWRAALLAMVPFVAQGAIKVVVVSGDAGQLLPFVWMAGCTVAPWAVFVVRRGRS